MKPHRTGAAVHGHREPRCPLCRLPMRRTDLVEDLEGVGIVHAFCAQEGQEGDG